MDHKWCIIEVWTIWKCSCQAKIEAAPLNFRRNERQGLKMIGTTNHTARAQSQVKVEYSIVEGFQQKQYSLSFIQSVHVD